MKLKKGSKVEVLSKKEVPSGSWQCAEIIGRSGHTYKVRYDIPGGTTVVEKVSRKAIRPSSTPAEILGNWAPGDLVEVFHDAAWKLATISEVVGKKHFLARLLGTSFVCKVSKLNVRVRRWWEEDQWLDFGKDSKSYEPNQHSSLKIKKTNTRMNPCLRIKGPRASPYCSLQDERMRRRAIGSNRAELAEPVDNVSVVSSVASCSVNTTYASPMDHLDSGDAESFCGSRHDNRNGFRKDELASEIHRLELTAYRQTIGALHASGPLTWEQEEMMTDLRRSLHISNDEHLLEVRNLVSADTSINFR